MQIRATDKFSNLASRLENNPNLIDQFPPYSFEVESDVNRNTCVTWVFDVLEEASGIRPGAGGGPNSSEIFGSEAVIREFKARVEGNQ